jgi:hypothetical protein
MRVFGPFALGTDGADNPDAIHDRKGSGGDDQRLSERMGMPCRARAGFERHQFALSTGGIGRIE